MRKTLKLLMFFCACSAFAGAGTMEARAAMNLETDAPVAGVSVAINNYYASSLNPEEELATAFSSGEALTAAQNPEAQAVSRDGDGVMVKAAAKSAYDNVAVSRVSNYVNVRSEANTASAVVGKIYNNCAATIVATVDGEGGKWYQIQSGSVNGYIKAQYFITGAEAESVARQVGTSFARVANTSTLRLREAPNLESRTLDLLSPDAEYEVIGEEGEFAKIAVDTDLVGYVFKDYINIRVEFDKAVTLEEEQAKKDETAQLKKEADEAIKRMEEAKKAAEAEKQTAETKAPETKAAETKAPETDAPENKAPEQSFSGTVEVNPAGGSASGNGSSLAPGTGAPGTSGTGSVSGNAPGKNETSAAETKAPETKASETKASEGPKAPGTGGSSGSAPGASSGGSKAPGTSAGSGGPGGGSSSGSAVANATRSAIVAYAKQFLGNPYVYGGTSLTNGADCSGFTQGVYKHFGITTGRSSRDQAAKGREISVSSAQPGDLLFYASGNYINHVAMYIGGGQVIHASTSKTGITISPSNYRTPCKAVTFLD